VEEVLESKEQKIKLVFETIFVPENQKKKPDHELYDLRGPCHSLPL